MGADDGDLGWAPLGGREAEETPVHVVRLVTVADLGDDDDPRPEASQMDVAVSHEAELSDGRRVVILTHGWMGSGPSHIWATESAEEIVQTSREVVAPDWDVTEEDEARDARARELAQLYRFGYIAGAAEQHGAFAFRLKDLSHEVELTERLRARFTHDPGPGPH